VYVGCPSSPGQAVACNDDFCGTSPQVTFACNQNTLYRIRIGGNNGAMGSGTMTISCNASCVGDINGSSAVDINDLVQVITHWGPCPPPSLCPGDVNGDGVIDINDLVMVVTHWG
jgi:hypothetical protein